MVRLILVTGLLAAGLGSGHAQRASLWRAFRTSDGLADPFCTTITFSPRGQVLVKHANSDRISVFDGFDIRTLPSPRPGVFRIHETRSGQVWAINSLGLDQYRSGAWLLHRVPEIIAENQTNTDRLGIWAPILPVRQGKVWVLLSDSLIEFSLDAQPATTALLSAEKLGIGRFIDMSVAADGGLWISAERGIARLAAEDAPPKPDAAWEVNRPPSELGAHNFRNPMPDGGHGVTMVCEVDTRSERAIAHFDGSHWTLLGQGSGRLRFAWRTQDGIFHGLTLNSAVRIEESQPAVVQEDPDIVAGSYYDLAAEPGGAFWLATQDGIYRQAMLAWGKPAGLRQTSEPVRAIHEDARGQMLFLCAREVLILRGKNWRTLPLPENAETGLQSRVASALLDDGTLLFDNEGTLFQLDTETGAMRTFNPLPGARVRLLGAHARGAVFSILPNPGSDSPPTLMVYSQGGLKPLEVPPLPPAVQDPLWCYTGATGRLLLAATNAVALQNGSQWIVATPSDLGPGTEPTCAQELSDGRLWLGTRQSIWEFNGKTWGAQPSGVDRANAFVRSARDGSVWCAARNGLHRNLRGEWITSGVEEGLPTEGVLTAFEDSQGRLWAGTTRGLVLYRPEADLDAPQSTILNSADQTLPAAESTINVQFRGRDKWKFTPASRLLFSHSLDGREWSSFGSETSVSLSELKAGTHRFQVRAMDRNGNIELQPALLEFTVALPWYQETRLLFFTSLGLLVAMFFAWLAWNRHRELVRSHSEIEKIVQVRTQQLERAHDELLHSEKMRALGTLAAGIAHDFNNILSIIKGSVQIIEGNLQNQDKVLTRTSRIRTVVQQGAEIVQAMLGFSRLPEQQIALCDVNVVAEDTLRLLGDHFLRRMKLDLNLAEGLPEVPASKNFLQQILLNFIFNAADATEGTGRIILHTGRVLQPASPLALAPERAEGYLYIGVQDFGCGIKPELVSRIFEPFFTTKGFSARRGTGLGLTMAYELAGKMGCGLKVESTPGQGSTFTVFVPIRPIPTSGGLADDAQPRLTPQDSS